MPPRLTEADWQALLASELPFPVRVRYGRARRQVIRVERKRGGAVLHLSAFFAEAPDEVRDALVRWMRSGKRAHRAIATLDRWIELRVRELADHDPRPARLEPRGRVHALDQIANELRHAEFAQGFSSGVAWPAIGWGRAKGSRSRRSLRLGSYDPIARAIRIHPVLDSEHVERWFVRYVVFHELLHAEFDTPHDGNGRRVHHGPRFRARERAYRDTARASEWEKLHIEALIRCARAERPFEPTRARARRTPTLAKAKSWVQKLLF